MYAFKQISPKYQKWSYLRQRKYKLMQLKASCCSIYSTVHRYVLGTGHLCDLYTLILGGIMTDNNRSWNRKKRPKWGCSHIRHYLCNIYALFYLSFWFMKWYGTFNFIVEWPHTFSIQTGFIKCNLRNCENIPCISLLYNIYDMLICGTTNVTRCLL